MPDHLWGVDKRRKAQADRMWEKNDFDKAVLTSKQFEEFEQLLRKGDPYKTERRKELQLSLDVYGYKEPVFVNVCAPPKYKANCGETFGMVMTFHGGP
ncbi:MAG: hypothetical protein U5N86_09150 [Planctomycetota bacterium]|nr:hypothetical protein [Planctomycetota bacterium]